MSEMNTPIYSDEAKLETFAAENVCIPARLIAVDIVAIGFIDQVSVA
jgi:hypothetical protein